jgi:hypothetical protein
MRIVSVFYAAFGYLTLLAAILWGMLFAGEDVNGSLMDAPATAPPPWRSSCSMPPGSPCRKGSGMPRGLSSGRLWRCFISHGHWS